MMFKDNPEGQTQYEIPSGDSTEEMRREFDARFFHEPTRNCRNDTNPNETIEAMYIAWQADIASKQEELEGLQAAARFWQDKAGGMSEEIVALLAVIEQMREGIYASIHCDYQGYYKGRHHVEQCQEALALTPDMTAIKKTCKKCGGQMKLGKAIEQTWTGSPDFPGDIRCVSMSPGGQGVLIDCMKCSSCGWSVTKQGE